MLSKSKRINELRKEEEILGFDAIENARDKGIKIQDLLASIQKKFPDQRRKGC